MNAAGEGERLPRSIGGLIGFALSSVAANVPLYAALALGVFAAYAIAEYAVPTAALTTPQGQFKLAVIQYTGLFADALVVAAVALGVASRAADAKTTPNALMAGAIERWLPVIAVSFLAQSVVTLTAAFSGLVQPPEPRALVVLTAPLVWILWAILGLTGPFVVLGSDRAVFLVVAGFGRAFTLSLQRPNLVRLCVLAVVTVLPNVLQTLLFNALLQAHVPRVFFWANAPIDALTIAAVAAIQTAFALDFARRAGAFDQPPPR